MALTNLIAKTKDKEVYLEDGMAIKVFNKKFPKAEVLYEALNTARIEDIGIPVPRISEVSKIEDCWAITMEYIQGETLYDVMKKNPGKTDMYIKKMVELQMKVHEKRVPLLNKLKDKMIRQIDSLEEIDSVKKYELLTRLDSMPKHVKLCHGDFNPKNIIVAEDGKWYVIDWVHASQGNASADVARTYLLFALEDIKLADKYLEVFCEESETDKKYVQQWLPIVAAAQLTKKREEEKDLLLRWLDVFDFQ